MTIADSEEIYFLKDHEVAYATMCFGFRTDVIRVPGGWIYRTIQRLNNGQDQFCSETFIPMSKF